MDRTPAPLEIDGARVAQRIGLDVATFRQLMDEGKVTVLCERGIGEDAGTWRATFYYGRQRARFLIDAHGEISDG